MTRVGRVLFGADDVVAELVKSRLAPWVSFRDYAALGVVLGDTLIGGVVYHNFMPLPYGSIIEASFAFDDPRWASRTTLRTLFAYPFVQLGCVRMTVIVAKKNERSRSVVSKLGFKQEGSHPGAFDGRQTAISYGMAKDACKWLKGS